MTLPWQTHMRLQVLLPQQFATGNSNCIDLGQAMRNFIIQVETYDMKTLLFKLIPHNYGYNNYMFQVYCIICLFSQILYISQELQLLARCSDAVCCRWHSDHLAPNSIKRFLQEPLLGSSCKKMFWLPRAHVILWEHQGLIANKT